MSNAIEPGLFLVVGVHHVPRAHLSVGSGKHIPLEVPLPALPLGRSGKGDDAADARVQRICKALGAILARTSKYRDVRFSTGLNRPSVPLLPA